MIPARADDRPRRTRPFVAAAPDAPIAPGPVPTFSIVIPAFQAASFIGEALRSALTQTLQPREIIVCDDGSIDDLASAVAPFEDRIRFLHRPRRGVGAARNAAIEVASGDFIALLDADDVFEPERLEALGELAAARPDLDILGTDAYYVVDGVLDGRFYDTTSFFPAKQRVGIMDACFVPAAALRRQHVLDAGGFDESLKVGEDWDLLIRLILGGSKAGVVLEPLLRYRRHASSATADRTETLWSRVSVLEKTLRYPALSPEERQVLHRCLIRARSRAVLNDARALSATDAPGSRRSLLSEARARGIAPATRFALVYAALMPIGAASILTWAERRFRKWRVDS